MGRSEPDVVAVSAGGGSHGPRHRGVFDTGNLRIEMLVAPEVATKLLECVVHGYAGLSIIAFSQDVEAVPRQNFTP